MICTFIATLSSYHIKILKSIITSSSECIILDPIYLLLLFLFIRYLLYDRFVYSVNTWTKEIGEALSDLSKTMARQDKVKEVIQHILSLPTLQIATFRALFT